MFSDFADFPRTIEQTADFVYFSIYISEMKNYLKTSDVYCGFNNDMKGVTMKNVRGLKKLLE